jgi:threonylcarbamoyladenosine tRNA methylthiotransferase CDKAL1
MIGQLVEYGYRMVPSVDEADLVLINSCTVVNPSQDAFINMVVKAKKIKKPIVVAGCVPQGDQHIPELAEISAVGVTQIDRIV